MVFTISTLAADFKNYPYAPAQMALYIFSLLSNAVNTKILLDGARDRMVGNDEMPSLPGS